MSSDVTCTSPCLTLALTAGSRPSAGGGPGSTVLCLWDNGLHWKHWDAGLVIHHTPGGVRGQRAGVHTQRGALRDGPAEFGDTTSSLATLSQLGSTPSLTHSLTPLLSHSLPHSFSHSLTHSLILSLGSTPSLTPSLSHSLTHSLILSLTLSLTHSLFHSLSH
jgi:hypothetical protein